MILPVQSMVVMSGVRRSAGTGDAPIAAMRVSRTRRYPLRIIVRSGLMVMIVECVNNVSLVAVEAILHVDGVEKDRRRMEGALVALVGTFNTVDHDKQRSAEELAICRCRYLHAWLIVI